MESKTTHTESATPKPRVITIGKVSVFGIIEIGPFGVPLPTHVGALRGVIVILLLTCIVGAGAYWFAVRAPLAHARDAMRMARYDAALDSLVDVPGWVAKWPQVADARVKAELGTKFNTPPQNWDTLGGELVRLRNASPNDVDLMVLDATNALRKKNYDEARKTLMSAVKVDPQNAEAWFLLGYEQDLAGRVEKTEDYYRKAVEAAPDSPQYRSNLARSLLDHGKVDQAIEEYGKISQFPLARVEQALGHWSRSEMSDAAGAQRDAANMLDNSKLMERFYNRRGWMFLLPRKKVHLTDLVDKRCYALLGEAASRRLAGETAIAFPATKCNNPPLEIRELLADDLCRFVDLPQPSLAAAAGSLRGALGQPQICPAAVPRPKSAPSEKIS